MRNPTEGHRSSLLSVLDWSLPCVEARLAEVEQGAILLEDRLAAMTLRAEAAEQEKAKLAEGLTRKGHEQEEASDAALQALAQKRCCSGKFEMHLRNLSTH